MPFRASAAVLDAVAQGVAQTMAALHQHGVGRGVQLVGGGLVDAIEAGGEVVGDVVEVGSALLGTVGVVLWGTGPV